MRRQIVSTMYNNNDDNINNKKKNINYNKNNK